MTKAKSAMTAITIGILSVLYQVFRFESFYVASGVLFAVVTLAAYFVVRHWPILKIANRWVYDGEGSPQKLVLLRMAVLFSPIVIVNLFFTVVSDSGDFRGLESIMLVYTMAFGYFCYAIGIVESQLRTSEANGRAQQEKAPDVSARADPPVL